MNDTQCRHAAGPTALQMSQVYWDTPVLQGIRFLHPPGDICEHPLMEDVTARTFS